MKLNSRSPLLLLLALAAGCSSPVDPAEPEEILGSREQKALLAKARPLQEFGLSLSFPFGNNQLYIGSTLLEPEQSALRRIEPDGLPIITLQGRSDRTSLTALLDLASNTSWMQYSSAQKNKLTFLSTGGQPIPYRGSAGKVGIDAYAGVVPLLKIDELSLNNTPFYIRMARGTMQPLVYSDVPSRVDAVLGYDNLRQFEYIRFDLRKGTIRFSTSTPYEPDEDRAHRPRLCRRFCLCARRHPRAGNPTGCTR